MDIPIEKKPWYHRYRFHLLGGSALMLLFGYVISLSLGPQSRRVARKDLRIVEVTRSKFHEYIDVEGLVQPIQTVKVNTLEAGFVERLVADEGSRLQTGDTLLVLTNPDLLRSLDDQRDEWEKQRIAFQEKRLEMEQQTLTLKQQALTARYELERLHKSILLDREEFRMGIRSKAQLQVAEDQYRYQLENTRLQLESLKQDSSMTLLRRELLGSDLERETKKLQRAEERLRRLVVRAPVGGQLSFTQVTLGESLPSGACIAEIKVLDAFKVHATLSEYYVDRITPGLPATITYQGQRFPLKISKVVPEVKERLFDTDLVFTEGMPDNVRVGKSYRVQIELGQPEPALVLPRGDFLPHTGGRWVYRVNAERTRAVKVPLTLGRQNPEQYEIVEGLQPGDLVIVTGYDTFGQAETLILE